MTTMRTRIAEALLALTLLAAPAAATCRADAFEGVPVTLCEVAAGQDLRLFLNDPGGVPILSFSRLATLLEAQGQRLVFAMNAGMYHADRAPVGLYLEAGVQGGRLVTREGPGNFGLLPNGVFCILDDGFAVIESRTYQAAPPECRYANQSGPMLVIDGNLHPRFREGSDSLNIRNGVGVSADGQRAVLAISDVPVNFHAFARLFRDHLGLPNALFLDGSISRLYAPELGRSDWGAPMGPMIGLVEPAG
jgi:uncharacterized protein YigE (DUF2233 family)